MILNPIGLCLIILLIAHLINASTKKSHLLDKLRSKNIFVLILTLLVLVPGEVFQWSSIYSVSNRSYMIAIAFVFSMASVTPKSWETEGFVIIKDHSFAMLRCFTFLAVIAMLESTLLTVVLGLYFLAETVVPEVKTWSLKSIAKLIICFVGVLWLWLDIPLLASTASFICLYVSLHFLVVLRLQKKFVADSPRTWESIAGLMAVWVILEKSQSVISEIISGSIFPLYIQMVILIVLSLLLIGLILEASLSKSIIFWLLLSINTKIYLNLSLASNSIDLINNGIGIWLGGGILVLCLVKLDKVPLISEFIKTKGFRDLGYFCLLCFGLFFSWPLYQKEIIRSVFDSGLSVISAGFKGTHSTQYLLAGCLDVAVIILSLMALIIAAQKMIPARPSRNTNMLKNWAAKNMISLVVVLILGFYSANLYNYLG